VLLEVKEHTDMTTSTIGVLLSTTRFIELVDFLRRKGSDRDPADVIDNAIEYWMTNADWKEEDLMPEIFEQPKHLGYHWRPLLLPPGTKIRMTYKGVTSHAEIVGDDFIYDGSKLSPSAFANMIANDTSRNAWRDLWIKRPSDQDFQLADSLRRPDIRLITPQ
jgi:hypothetical protein